MLHTSSKIQYICTRLYLTDEQRLAGETGVLELFLAGRWIIWKRKRAQRLHHADEEFCLETTKNRRPGSCEGLEPFLRGQGPRGLCALSDSILMNVAVATARKTTRRPSKANESDDWGMTRYANKRGVALEVPLCYRTSAFRVFLHAHTAIAMMLAPT
jgi:hypothetical protein